MSTEEITLQSQPTPAAPAGDLGRIVVGVDGSDASKDALRWAHRQATLTGSELTAVAVWSYATMSYPSMSAYMPTVNDLDLEGDTTQMLEQCVKEVLGDVPIRMVVMEGHPADVLLQLSAGADAVVLGCRGHGGFVGAILGSVSQHLVSAAQCPVVVIRHPKEPHA
ncbi:MAG: universal stress protein [Kineosporiaceae bacterium]|jgi:nucleotide-binding universal stress UspA family protein